MALIDDIKASLRIVSDAYDAEVEMLIGAAIYDMRRVGIAPGLLEVDGGIRDGDLENALVKKGVTAYCKANFGYDVDEAPRFDDSYNRVVVDLLNSSDNASAATGAAAGPDCPAAADAGGEGE